MVTEIRYIDVPAAIHGHALWGITTKIAQYFAVAGKLQDAMVPGIRYIDFPAAIHSHALGGVEVEMIIANSPRGQEGAVVVKHIDDIIHWCRHIDVPAAAIHGHAG